MLLRTPGALVTTAALNDRVWGDRVPAAGVRYKYIGWLRKELEPLGVPLIQRDDGYLLQIDHELVDLHQFRRLVGEARRAGEAGQPGAAADLAREALRLWRGPALAGVPGDWAASFRDQLDAERRDAAILRFRCELTLGRERGLIPELAEWVTEHPADEAATALLMTALYRTGQQAQALDCYRNAAARIRSALDTEPGPELQELRQRIQDRDPLLLPARPAGPDQDPPAARPHHPAVNNLPLLPGNFVGREQELDQLVTAVTADPGPGAPAVTVHAIDGMAGVGKTAFTVHAAHVLTDRYPDAQIYIDLHGYTPGELPAEPAVALETLLMTAVGVPGREIPPDLTARATLWRSSLADKRVLLVLDNAASHEQVRLLLPGATSHSAVLITSRRRLAGLEEAVPLSLEPLRPQDAAALFGRIAGPDRTADGQKTAEIVAACGCLPLAIKLIAGRFRHRPSWTVSHLAAELGTGSGPLDAIHAEGRSMEAIFELSYGGLSAPLRRMFRLLGMHLGPEITVGAAAALARISPLEAGRQLQQLVDHNLIQEPAPGRYLLHDLLRDYARRLAEQDRRPQRDNAVRRLLDYQLAVAWAISRVVHPLTCEALAALNPPAAVPEVPADPVLARGWLRREQPNLLACAHYALRHDHDPHAFAFPALLGPHLRWWGHWEGALLLHQTALDAAVRRAEPRHQAGALRGIADTEYLIDRYEEALSHYQQAHGISQQAGDRRGESEALRGIATIERATGRHSEALPHYQEALALARAAGDQDGAAEALRGVADVERVTGHFTEAFDHYREAHEGSCATGNRNGQAEALRGLADVERSTGHFPGARAHCQQTLDLCRETGDRTGEVTALWGIADIERLVGDYHQAHAHYQEIYAISQEIGNHAGEAYGLWGIADTERSTGRRKEALIHHRQARKLFCDIGDRNGEIIALWGSAEAERETGHPAKALALCQRAQVIAEETGNRVGLTYALRGLASAERDAGHYKDALGYYEQASALSAEMGNQHGEAEALHGMGVALRQLGQPEEARDALAQALSIYESLKLPQAAEVRQALQDTLPD